MSDYDWDNLERPWWPARRVETGLRLLSPVETFAFAIRAWMRSVFLRRTRRPLLDLTEGQLSDIGRTREEALAEARRSIHFD